MCPIPDCGEAISSSDRQCACAQKIRLVDCPGCKMVCTGYARFCRACGADISRRGSPRFTKLTGPYFSSIPGKFKGRPQFANGFFWALTGFDDIYRLSPEAGAAALQWAKTPSATAGSSRFAVTEVRAAGSAFQGGMLVTGNSRSIYAVSLVDRSVHEIGAARGSEEFLFEDDVSVFTGLAASPDFVSYLMRGGPGSKTTLCVRYFNPGRAVDQPFSMESRPFVGPVIRSGAVAVLRRRRDSLIRHLDFENPRIHISQRVRAFSQPAKPGPKCSTGPCSFRHQQSKSNLEGVSGGRT